MKRTIRRAFGIVRLVVMAGLCLFLMAANDCDGDGFSPPFDCNDNDANIHPLALENADWADSNCNGYEDVAIGLTREKAALKGGTAMAVEYYGDYVYVAASSWLKIYLAPPGSIPIMVGQVELREMVREMHISGNTLFLANRGDGLIAMDLTTPSNPVERGRVSGYFVAPGLIDPVGAAFNGVDATFDSATHTVAVAVFNDIFSQGSVDAAVFSYDPLCDPQREECFTVINAFDSDFLRGNELSVPVVVGLTQNGDGLFVGYSGQEMVYTKVDGSGTPLSINYTTGVFDIAMHGDDAYVASGKIDGNIKLSRVRLQNNALVRENIHSVDITGAGAAVDISGDTLCFGIGGPDRDPQGHNLYVFDGVQSGGLPTLAASEGTQDWIFQLAYRETGSGTGYVFVADEWAGLQFWQRNQGTLTRPYDDTHYSSNHEEYPPAVFVAHGTSSLGRVAIIGTDRNTGKSGAPYFMIFKQKPDQQFECIYAEALSDYNGRVVASEPISADESLLMIPAKVDQPSNAVHHLRIYQHCVGTTEDDVRLVAVAEVPSRGYPNILGDAVVAGEYLFVTEMIWTWVDVFPHDGLVHVFKWRDQPIASCGQPVTSFTPEYLNSFGGAFNPYSLMLDESDDTLYVGTSRSEAPYNDVALLVYEGLSSCYINPDSCFDDPENGIELLRTEIYQEGSIARSGDSRPDVRSMVLDGDTIHFVDYFNGLYSYSLSSGIYERFYPAHRPDFHHVLRPEVMLAPQDTYPLNNPIVVEQVDVSGQKMLVVQEHTSSRVAILTED